MNNEVYLVPKDELYHYGVKGMKWGHRKARYTSEAGTRYATAKAAYKTSKRDFNKAYNKAYNYSAFHPVSQFSKAKQRSESDRRWADATNKSRTMDKAQKDYKRAKKEYKQSDEYAAKRKKALKAGAAVAATALAAYGAYKINDYVKTKNYEIASERGKKAMSQYMDDNMIASRRNSDGSVSWERANNWRNSNYKEGRTHSMSSEAATKMMVATHRHNMSVLDKAKKLAADERARAENDNFRTAAKNVYDDYRKKKRK